MNQETTDWPCIHWDSFWGLWGHQRLCTADWAGIRSSLLLLSQY